MSQRWRPPKDGIIFENDARPFSRIVSRAQSNLQERIEGIYSDIAIGDSPIEQLLFTALFVEIETGRHEHSEVVPFPKGKRRDPDIMKKTDDILIDTYKRVGMPLIVEAQAYVLDWPVDFFITARSQYGGYSSLAVECDGHEFHERTKAQAKKDRSRDRRLQQAGYTVFRFTGSEIWNDPCACADQIIEWALDAYYGPPYKREGK